MITPLKKFVLNLQFIFRPSYWLMHGRYDKKLDEFMNKLMDTYKFANRGGYSTDGKLYTVFLGDVEVWIGNHPYCSFMPYRYVFEIRPSRLTILRGIRKLKSEIDIKKVPQNNRDQFYKLHESPMKLLDNKLN